MNGETLYVWDFNGTLELGWEKAVLMTTNKVLRAHRDDLSVDQPFIDSHYGKRWYTFFEALLPGLPLEAYLAFEAACIDRMRADIPEMAHLIRPTEHADLVLNEIQNLGNDQILISNMRGDDLGKFLSAVSFDRYFPEGRRFGTADYSNGQPASKLEILNDYVRDRNYQRIVAVGDSPGDVEIVQGFENGISYLYAHPGKPFREFNAQYRIRDLRDVLSVIRE
jgi:phosphoglycolate phosphatase-like HAD superfamily hydrolase